RSRAGRQDRRRRHARARRPLARRQDRDARRRARGVMAPRWRKALRDFWEERTRTVLVVLAIALGIAGFTAVLSSFAVLTRELDRGYLATNPASANLRTDVIDDKLVASILSGHGVSDAEPRRGLP